jgi:hypothetical protein
MDTIKNYLESMFAQLPNTPDVWRAKDELLQMMEDRYNDLVSSGKTENEAVGSVIAEFGNLDELAETLGISHAMNQKPEYEAKNFSLEDAHRMIEEKSRGAFITGIAVLLFICCCTGPIITSSIVDTDISGSIGVGIMFIMIATGVGLLVYEHIKLSHWNFLKNEPYQINAAAASELYRESESYRSTNALLTAVGIILIVVCVIPVSILGTLNISDRITSLGAASMFYFIGIGVMILIASNGKEKAYKEILSLNAQSTIAGSYVPRNNREEQYSSTTAAIIMGIFWPTVTCLYLIISFITFDWGRTWLIWPIAGVIHTLIKNIVKVGE